MCLPVAEFQNFLLRQATYSRCLFFCLAVIFFELFSAIRRLLTFTGWASLVWIFYWIFEDGDGLLSLERLPLAIVWEGLDWEYRVSGFSSEMIDITHASLGRSPSKSFFNNRSRFWENPFAKRLINFISLLSY